MSGTPVLLVHGLASSFDLNWREPGWVDLLSDAGREVIGIDLLGHGKADKPHDPAAYEDVTSDIVAALPDDGSAVQAIGFSMGARLLLEVACDHPDRFERIVVAGIGAGVFAGGSSEALAKAIEGGVVDEAHGTARLFAQFAAGSGNDPKALGAFLRRESSPLDRAKLAGVTCPVLVVLGDQDFAAPAEPLVEALPNARFVSLKGVDHFATPKDFKFLDAALEFLGAT
ncbi:MAG TPA: alpha/beta fold hydrolase [Acidimicrobiales bacterium]|nr:alpha/beta fold hydrolase [Acidimicrobiales bacterium]